ncbi:oligosaccharide flippase family protein [Tissierella sp. MSJ-40]|uniref:Oligosaccharide flippase family protein n=1 Tax=Tissierella simiarum TaxID=2841534 RepID=A0ABS6E1N7_9FIRM|nr:lipid II flippase MurJ [Tissierella simiarum]MBU5436816.1 oligosaccharide flippase family protein [Tissierella simiarum]
MYRAYIFNGFLHIKGNYVIPALIRVPINFFIIISIGSVVAITSQLILLVPFIHRKGYRHNFVLDIKNEYIKNIVYIALLVTIGVSVNQVNVLVDRTLASSVAIGGISALNYANKLNGFVQGLFVISVATAMYPMIFKMTAENNIKELKETILEDINSISLLAIPVTIGAMFFAEPIVKLLFGRGAI